jgi:branched-chain amino acid transport system permease protein
MNNPFMPLTGHKIKVFFILLLMVTVMLMLRERYLALVLCNICIYAIAVSGLDILFGYTGQVSFGHAGYYAIGSYCSTLLSIKLGIPVTISMLIASFVAMLFGVIMAFPAARLVKHFLSLLSIAFGNMIFMLISATSWLTNGFSGIMNIPPVVLFGYPITTNQGYFFFCLVITALMLVCKHHIIESRTGRAFIAIRENVHAANGMGINVRYYKVLAFALSAFYTGLAGSLYAHLVRFISPDTYTNITSNLFMTMLLFGGIASLFGPLVGSAILVVCTELMQSLIRYQMLIYAIFILAILFFLPNGVIGTLDTIRDAVKKHFKHFSGRTSKNA